MLLWDNFNSVLTFSELVLAPCNQRVCTGMELSGIPFPRMSFGRLVHDTEAIRFDTFDPDGFPERDSPRYVQLPASNP